MGASGERSPNHSGLPKDYSVMGTLGERSQKKASLSESFVN